MKQKSLRHLLVNGISLSFSDEGEGDVLFLLHGFTRTAASHWTINDRAQFSGYRKLIPDLRGHGRTVNDGTPLSHLQFAKDLRELCHTLDIERAHFVGFSSGGMTLHDLASIAPNLMLSMTVISAGIRIPESARERIRQLVDPELNPDYDRTIGFLDEIHTEDQGENYGREILQHWHRLTEPPTDPDRSDSELRGIKVPTFIIHGDRDPYFPVEQAHHAHGLIPDCQILVLPNCGHFIPEEVSHSLMYPRIQRFLQETTPNT